MGCVRSPSQEILMFHKFDDFPVDALNAGDAFYRWTKNADEPFVIVTDLQVQRPGEPGFPFRVCLTLRSAQELGGIAGMVQPALLVEAEAAAAEAAELGEWCAAERDQALALLAPLEQRNGALSAEVASLRAELEELRAKPAPRKRAPKAAAVETAESGEADAS